MWARASFVVLQVAGGAGGGGWYTTGGDEGGRGECGDDAAGERDHALPLGGIAVRAAQGKSGCGVTSRGEGATGGRVLR
jgi:hypothetical protein